MAGLFAGSLLILALRGGSYDLVPRGQSFVVLWWALGLAAALGVLPRRRMAPAVRVSLAALVLLAAWTSLGLLWTDSAERTLAEVVRVLGYVGLVALLAWTVGTRDRTLVVGMVTAVAGAVCVLALISRLAPDVLSSATSRAGFHADRLSYPFNYWNALGCWSAMTLALALGFSAHASARWVRGASLAIATVPPVVGYLTYSRTGLVGLGLAAVLVVGFSSRRWLAALNMLIAGAGATVVVLVIRAHPEIARATGTGGRGTVALAAALVALAALATAFIVPQERLGRVRMPRRGAQRVMAVVVAIVLAGAVFVGPSLAHEAWQSFTRPSETTAKDPARRLTSLGGQRQDMWQITLDVFVAHPVHGVGAGTFEFVWNRDARHAGHVLDAHSLYLEALAELGLPGGVLVVLALGALLVAVLRAPARHADGAARGAAAGCAAAFVVFCISAGVDWMWESTAVCCAALILGTVAAGGEAKAVGRPRWPVRTGLALASAAAIAIQLPVLIAASELRASQKNAAKGQLTDALSDAGAAVESEPWASSGYLQRALVLEAVGKLGPAAIAARHATEHEPTNWQPWLIRGRIEAERGRVTPALAAVTRARTLNPGSYLFRRPEPTPPKR